MSHEYVADFYRPARCVNCGERREHTIHSTGAKHMSRIIELAQSYGEFVTGDDGFVVYWPTKEFGGSYTAYDLRTLADELDRRNAAWEADIKAYLEKESNT